MNYQERDAANKQAAVMAADVAAAGERLGFWKVADHREDGNDQRWIDVESDDDNGAPLTFTLSGGGWQRENTIAMSVASVTSGPFKVAPYDIRRYQEDAIDANASVTRGAEAIAKDLNRRVVQNVEARGQARRVRESIVAKLLGRVNLLQQIDKLKPLGFTFPRLEDTASYKAEPQSPYSGLRITSLYAGGTATVELTDLPVEKIAGLIKFLGLTR